MSMSFVRVESLRAHRFQPKQLIREDGKDKDELILHFAFFHYPWP
jgi:hypothetical protein